MGPNLDCFQDWGLRLAGAVILEHILLALQQWMARQKFRNIPLEAKLLQAKRNYMHELANDDNQHLLPDLDEHFARDLKAVFEWFDTDSNGELSFQETEFMFEALLVSALVDTPEQAAPGLQNVHKDALKKLFNLMDKDQNRRLSYAEVQTAVRCASVDPYLTLLFSSDQLELSASRLAHRIRQGHLLPRVRNPTQLEAMEELLHRLAAAKTAAAHPIASERGQDNTRLQDYDADVVSRFSPGAQIDGMAHSHALVKAANSAHVGNKNTAL